MSTYHRYHDRNNHLRLHHWGTKPGGTRPASGTKSARGANTARGRPRPLQEFVDVVRSLFVKVANVGADLISTASCDTLGEKWTLPVGGQFGRIAALFTMPVPAVASTFAQLLFRLRSRSQVPGDRPMNGESEFIRMFKGQHCMSALLAVLLVGCTNQAPVSPPSVSLEIGGDEFPMNPSSQGAPPSTSPVEPPPNRAVPAGSRPLRAAESGPPRNGQYAGTGTATFNPFGGCKSPIHIQNWFVSGDNVSFGAFQGTIQPDGSLTMEVRHTWISGRFVGSHFEGSVWQGIGVGCQYQISMEPSAQKAPPRRERIQTPPGNRRLPFPLLGETATGPGVFPLGWPAPATWRRSIVAADLYETIVASPLRSGSRSRTSRAAAVPHQEHTRRNGKCESPI
jgi:hypothetical protein